MLTPYNKKIIPILIIPSPSPKAVLIRFQRHPNLATLKRQIFYAERDYIAARKSPQTGIIILEVD